MRDWASAADHVRRRAFDGLVDSLEVEVPFAFDPVASISEMPDYLNDNWELIRGSPNQIIDLPGRDANLVRDCLISVCKFFHVLGCSRAQYSRGALTWTIVDAYHASLLGARAICALFGVLSYTVRGRTLLVDFRPEFGAVDHARKFKREYRNTSSPVRVLQPTSPLLEQKDAWGLLKRICNVCDRLDTDRHALSRLSEIADKPLSQLRNRVLYDSVFWQWRADFSLARPERVSLAETSALTGTDPLSLMKADPSDARFVGE